MVSLDDSVTNIDPLFDGTNYSFWRVLMRPYLIFFGLNIWLSIVDNYKYLYICPFDQYGKTIL